MDMKVFAEVLSKLGYVLRIDQYTDLNNYTAVYDGNVAAEFYYPNLKYAILTGADFANLPTYKYNDRYSHYAPDKLPNFNIVAIKRVLHSTPPDGSSGDVVYTTGLNYDINLYFDILDFDGTDYVYNNLILLDKGIIDTYNTVQLPQMSSHILNAVYKALTGLFTEKGEINQLYNTIFYNFTVCNDAVYNNVYTSRYPTESLYTSEVTGSYHYEIARMSLLELYFSLLNYAIGQLSNVTVEHKTHVNIPGLHYIHRVKNFDKIDFVQYSNFYNSDTDELNEQLITELFEQKKSGISLIYTTAYGEVLNLDYNAIEYIRILPVNSQYYGISDTVSPNFLARDFQTSKQELITFIQSYYPDLYNDLYEHSAGNFLIDIHSYLYTIWHAYIDKAQREATIGTMLETNNIINYAQSYGVFIPLLTGPSVDVTFSVDISTLSNINTDHSIVVSFDNHDFNKGAPLTVTDSNGNSWYYAATNERSAVELSVSSDNNNNIPFTLTFKLGSLKRITYTANGTDYENIQITAANLDYSSIVVFKYDPSASEPEDQYIRLTVDSQWDYVENKTDVLIRNSTADTITLVFGSSTYGYRLSPDDIIIVLYSTLPDTANPELAVQPDTLSLSTPVTITYTDDDENTQEANATAIISRNYAPTTTTDMRYNQTAIKQYIYARRFLFNSLTTEQEFKAFVKSYVNQYGTLKSNIFLFRSDYEAYPTDFVGGEMYYRYGDANLLLVFALIPDITDIYRTFDDTNPPPIIRQFYKDLLKYKAINIEVDVLSGFIQRVDFKVRVTGKIFNRTAITETITPIVLKYFNNIDYGLGVNLSDLLFEIEKTLRETYVGVHAVELLYRYEGSSTYISSSMYDSVIIKVNPNTLDDNDKARFEQYFGSNWQLMGDLINSATMLLPNKIEVEPYTGGVVPR